MIDRDRARVAYHGAVTLVVSITCGLLAVTEPVGLPMPSWQKAHGAFLLMAVWLFASAGVFPALTLDRTSARALVVSLVGTAYAFTTAVLVQTLLGVRIVGPEGPPLYWLAFLGNGLTLLFGFMSAGLVMMGAHASLRNASPAEAGGAAAFVSGD